MQPKIKKILVTCMIKYKQTVAMYFTKIMIFSTNLCQIVAMKIDHMYNHTVTHKGTLYIPACYMYVWYKQTISIYKNKDAFLLICVNCPNKIEHMYIII